MMSKKDYEALAIAISNATDIGKPYLVHKDQLISQLIPVFKRDNPLFNSFKFIDACDPHREKKLKD